MLPYKHTTFALSEEDKGAYDTLLDISGTGVMGYIEIPTINISLPVYHGTEDAVLQIAVGHLEWSSLPVGGEDTHCVLSGHRGLPSAKLFTNLDKLVVGDKFVMRVLDEVLTYEVDQILIVEPTDVSKIGISGMVRRSNGKRLIELRRAESDDAQGVPVVAPVDPVGALCGDLREIAGHGE